MGIKKSDGAPATYVGKPYPAHGDKYPEIKAGAKGVVVLRCTLSLEADPDRPLQFYPAAWGYVYGFCVSRHCVQVDDTIGAPEQRLWRYLMSEKTKLHKLSADNILQPDLGATKSEVMRDIVAYWLRQMPKRELVKVARFATKQEVSEKKSRRFLIDCITQNIFWGIFSDRRSVVETVNRLWSNTIPAFAVVVFHKENDWGNPDHYDCFQVTGNNNWGQANVGARLLAVRCSDIPSATLVHNISKDFFMDDNTIASAGEMVTMQYGDENGIMVQTVDGRVSFYAGPDEIAVEI